MVTWASIPLRGEEEAKPCLRIPALPVGALGSLRGWRVMKTELRAFGPCFDCEGGSLSEEGQPPQTLVVDLGIARKL